MALTKEDLQAIGALMDSKLEPIKDDISDLKSGQAVIQEDVDQIKKVAAKIDHEVIPKITALHDGYKLNSDKLDGIQKSLDEITPTVLALDVIHQSDFPTR